MDLKQVKNAYQGANALLNVVLYGKQEKNLILEPLTCMIRLATLHFKADKTKISIANNRISYNDPNLFQGTVRWSYGDNRNDLHNLHNPITKATQWYDLSCAEIRYLFSLSIKGLKKLMLSYDPNTIITHTLSHYLKLINDALQGSDNALNLPATPRVPRMSRSILNQQVERALDASLPSVEINSSTEEEEEDQDPTAVMPRTQSARKGYIRDVAEIQANAIYRSFKDLWNYRQVQIVTDIFLEMGDSQLERQEENNHYLEMLDVLLQQKEDRVNSILTTSTTVL